MRAFGVAIVVSLMVVTLARGQPSGASPAPASVSGVEAVQCPAPPQPPSESQRPQPLGPQPALPGCVDPVTHVGRCPRDVIPRYNAQIAAYNARVEARATAGHLYIEALNDWIREAQAYASCEVNVMNAESAGSGR